MAPSRQLELYPQKKRTAAERRALIRQRLDGLEYRQLARAERRREQRERRRAREASRGLAARDTQVTLDEMIERNRQQTG